MSTSMLVTFTNFLYLIPQVVIVIISCWFLSKRTSIESVLLTVGSIIGLLISCVYQFVLPYFMSSNARLQVIYPLLGIVSFLAASSFAIGLCILITKSVNGNNEKVGHSFPPIDP